MTGITRESYEVRLQNIFEGPMDLLVFLIQKNEINIYDIPIALITDQYLEYIEWLKFLNIDVAGEFMVMAATLMQIKSKMLLPVHPSQEGEDEDPRLQIVRPLEEYLQVKSIAEQLSKRYIMGEDLFVREPDPDSIRSSKDDELVKVSFFSLIDAFRRILENLPPPHQIDLTDEKISIKDKIIEIVDILEANGSVTFESLFPQGASKTDMIITFLAILEMAKLNLITISQQVQTGIIRLFYRAPSNEGDLLDTDEYE